MKNTDLKVVEIAFQYGFNSHELFTRNFLKMFQVTPSRYRKEKISVLLMDRIDILERDFKNENNDIVVDYSCREIKEIGLLGKEIHFHPEISCETEEVIYKTLKFAEEHFIKGTARQFFTIIRVDHSDPSRIFCFYGIAAEEYLGDCSGLEEKIIPESKYAIFKYTEGLGLIFPIVRKDLKKWFSVSGLEFNNNVGINVFELYTEDYKQTGKFYLYIPVL